MPTNDFKALALSGTRAATQANYLANADLLTNGFPTGVVDSSMFNKAFRQATFIAAVIGQIINDQAGIDALDDGVIANLETGFLRALRRFATNGMYGVDTGSGANVYQVPYSPAVSAVIDGEVFKFRASHANTGASTFTPNPGTIAAAPIWGADHAALGGGEIILNGDVWVQWNSALNGGTGAWVLVDSTGGYIKSPTPSQFDNSQKLATTAFVQRALGNLQGISTFGANTTLTAANCGQWLAPTTSGLTLTLPACSACAVGSTLTFYGNGQQTTLTRQGSDSVVSSGSVGTSLTLGANDTLALVNIGSGWYVFASTANVGVGQTWQDLTASRALATNYTNSTGKPIQIAVSATNSIASSTCGLSVTIGGVAGIASNSVIAGSVGNNELTVTAIVPPGATYSVQSAQATLSRWRELR